MRNRSGSAPKCIAPSYKPFPDGQKGFLFIMKEDKTKISGSLRFTVGKRLSASSNLKAGLEGFEPPTSGLEARRYVQAKPQAPWMY